jgi:hypothetical protein
MPVIINGSTGISGTDGTAATPAVQGTDTNTGVFFPAADTIAFSEGGTEAMRINSDAQVEHVAGTTALPSITAAGDTNTGMWFPAADTIAFSEGGTESLRLNASGNAVFTGTVQTAGITTPLYPLVSGTALGATGTSIDFTGIPSWARRVTIMLNGVSTAATSSVIFQIGSGSFVTTGYASQISVGGSGIGVITTGFSAFQITASSIISGMYTISQISTNVWCFSGVVANTSATTACTLAGGVSPTLGGALDRIRMTTVAGTDTFDAGSINIMWE